ncbi:MAG: pyridine nucleotide-disulfide oxidoreductase [Dehalococcoidia bacterium]|nr:MAG: pyridine nucleotide-disulfide oxidoreductase [Dehalococcoidia bacterium]
MTVRDRRSRPVVAIVGAGFGGLWAAKALRDAPVDVLMIDRRNFHTFYPLLYQLAAAELEPQSVAYPVRSIFRNQHNVRFLLADVERVEPTANTLHTSEGPVRYDYLILTPGSTTNYFGIPGAAEHAWPLRTLEDGMALRDHILSRFEAAAREPDPERRAKMLTFLIVGGGPTGVEFAGALSELIVGPLQKDYRELDLHEVSVVLIEQGPRILSSYPARLSDWAARRLAKLTVDLRLGEAVEAVEPDGVVLRGGERLLADTVVWVAGVRGDPAMDAWGLPLGRSGRVVVEPTLQVENAPNIFVVGDAAVLPDQPLPLVAQVAIQQGKTAAANIKALLSGQPCRAFRYRNLGDMAVIGRGAAVFSRGALQLTGFLAWILWAAVHIFNLIGFRNRLVVLATWAVEYLTFERGSRLLRTPGAAARLVSAR